MRWPWEPADNRDRLASSMEMARRLEQLAGDLERATLDLRSATAGLRDDEEHPGGQHAEQRRRERRGPGTSNA